MNHLSTSSFVSKCSKIMRSNTTKSTSTTNSQRRTNLTRKGNDEESLCNSNNNSNYNTNNNTNTNSNSNSKTNSGSKSTNTKPLPSVVCIEGNNSVFTAMVGRVVKDTIFPKQQFIILERELDENGKLADKCVQALNLERSKWYSVRNIVRVRLNRVRNNAQQCVRKRLLSKYGCLFS